MTRWRTALAALVVANEVRAVVTAPALIRTAWSHAHDVDSAMGALPWREQLALFALLGLTLVGVLFLLVSALRCVARDVSHLFSA